MPVRRYFETLVKKGAIVNKVEMPHASELKVELDVTKIPPQVTGHGYSSKDGEYLIVRDGKRQVTGLSGDRLAMVMLEGHVSPNIFGEPKAVKVRLSSAGSDGSKNLAAAFEYLKSVKNK